MSTNSQTYTAPEVELEIIEIPHRSLTSHQVDTEDSPQVSPGQSDDFAGSPPGSGISVHGNKARIASAFFFAAQVGMADSSLGAQLSAVQDFYGLSYTVVSLIFLSNVFGYLLACLITPFCLHHLGFRMTLAIGSTCFALGSVLCALSLPFPAFLMGLVFFGLAGGISESSLSTFMAFFNSGVLMSNFYALFGLGSLIAPLIVAAMLDNGLHWSYYYFVPLGLAIVGGVAAAVSFQAFSPPEDDTPPSGVFYMLRKAISQPVVILGCSLMSLAYASADLLASWIVSYMTTIRHGESVTMRYVLVGLFGGQALGRVVLSYPTSRYGIKYSTLIYLALSLGFLAIVQFFSSVLVDAIAVALVGFFAGPLIPNILTAISSQVTPSLRGSVIVSTTAVGLIGGAGGTLIMGVINSAGGLAYLASVGMGTTSTTAILWYISMTRYVKDRID